MGDSTVTAMVFSLDSDVFPHTSSQNCCESWSIQFTVVYTDTDMYTEKKNSAVTG